MSRVVLGCGNFGGVGSAPSLFGKGTTREEAFRLLDVAWDMGITTLDTADAYGGGRSEEYIGEWLRTKGPDVRDRVVIATKTFNPMAEGGDHGLGAARIRRQLETSLRRLGVERVPLYLAHDFDPDVPQEETLTAFDELVRRGTVGAVGASNFTAEQLAEALELSALEGLTRYEWVQNAFSLLEQGDRETVFPLCHEHGLGYTPFSPLAGGWLTGKYRRGEPPPAGIAHDRSPGGQRGVPVRRDVRRARGARARGRTSAASRWPGSRSPGSCTCPRSRPSSSARTASTSSLPFARRSSVHLDDARTRPRSRGCSGERPRPLAMPTSASCSTWSRASRRWRTSSPLSRATSCRCRSARCSARPPSQLMGLMPAHRGGGAPVFSLKEIVVAPANAARGLDPHQGAVLLHDGETGVLLAVLNASAITEIRTAAVSAVATKLLARPGARQVAILGSGVQGRSHAVAMRAVLHDPELRVWSRTPAHAEALALESHATRVRDGRGGARRRGRRLHVHRVARARSSRRAWLAPGTHVNAVGSSVPSPGSSTPTSSRPRRLFVDRRESTLNESGDYLRAVEEEGIGPDHILAELGELLVGAHPGRRDDEELTLFKSLGIAVEDLAAAALCVERAREQGVGVEVPF